MIGPQGGYPVGPQTRASKLAQADGGLGPDLPFSMPSPKGSASTDLVVVGGHPGEEDEGSPIVAEMGGDKGPDRTFAENDLPWDAPDRALQQQHALSYISQKFCKKIHMVRLLPEK